MRITKNTLPGLTLALATITTALPNPETVDQQGESRHAAHAPAGAELEDRKVEVPHYTPDPAEKDLFEAKHGFDTLVNTNSYGWKMASDRRSTNEEGDGEDRG